MKLRRALKLIKRVLKNKRHPFFEVRANVVQKRNGKVIWEGKGLSAWWNGLQDDGESDLLDVYFRNATAPTEFYVGFGNLGGTVGVPVDSATLATITEVVGTGYARQPLTRDATGFPTLTQDANGDYYVKSTTITMTNTDTTTAWTAADYGFLTDASTGTTGKLLVTVAFQSSRIIQPGDEIDFYFENITAS